MIIRSFHIGRFLQTYAVLIMIVFLVIALSTLSENFLTLRNLLNILNQNAPLAIMASAMTLVIIAGGFDLSVAAIFAMGSVMSAWIALHVDPYLGLFLAPFIGLILGTMNGVVINALRVHSFLATIATSLIFKGVAIVISDGRLISVRLDTFTWLGRDKLGGVFIAIWILVAFAAILTFVLNRTTFGRRVFAVGGNEVAAVLSGIRTDRVKTATFAIAGFAAGLAAIIATSRVALGQAGAGQGMELQAIAAVILGGTSIYGGAGAVWRSLGGVFLLALISNGFNILNADPFYRDLTTGLVILAAIGISAGGKRRVSRPCRASQGLTEIRAAMRAAAIEGEADAVHRMAEAAGLTPADRTAISAHAADLVRDVRASGTASIMQGFLAEYGLTTREGVALMCLAEALLRVPDTETIDALIEDKIGASDWAAHLGQSSSPLVNASTWALLLTGKVLGEAEEGLAGVLHGAIRRLGEPVIRAAVAQSMRELGHQFVLGRDMGEAMARAAELEAQGYSFSYDMLGEAARTEADARRYHLAYSDSITALAAVGRGKGIRDRPGISVKLSALHPRYEFGQHARVMTELAARLGALALLAKSAGIGLNVDAEEADRLDLSLDVIEAVFADPALGGWDGFGVVVQAYGKRAAHVIDWVGALARAHGRPIMVRLVKGAYWDSEIKRAQTLGLDGFPVFTRKESTDVVYLACAHRLLGMTDRLYPQFATHNAHTVAAVLHMAGGAKGLRVPAPARDGRGPARGGARGARGPLPHLRAGGRAP